jgi:flagellar motor switch protein FliM
MDASVFSRPPALPDGVGRTLEEHLRATVPRFGLLLGSLVRRDATASLAALERLSAADLPRAGHCWFLVTHGGPAGRTEPGVAVAPDELVVRLAEVLMGGPGLPSSRPPTKLEVSVVAGRLTTALAPVVAGLDELGVTDLRLTPVERDEARPAADLVRAAVELTVGDVAGTLEIALPSGLFGASGRDAAPADPHPTVVGALERVPVTVAIRFEAVHLTADEVDGLAVGDVIRLDHPVDRPLVGDLDGRPILLVRAGRQGRRLAVEVEEVLT